MTAYDDHVLADSPLLYWKLDELAGTTAADSSGNGNDGTYVGGVTLGAAGPLTCQGDPDSAASFDGRLTGVGTGQCVYRATSPLSGAGAFTVEEWLWPERDSFDPVWPFANTYQQRAFPKLPAEAGMLRIALGTLGTGGLAVIFGTTVEAEWPVDDMRARSGCWTHVAVTRGDGGADVVKMYANGQLLGTGSNTSSLTAANLAVGADSVDVDAGGYVSDVEKEQFRGRIAKVAVFGTALSQARLTARAALGCLGCAGGFVAGTAVLG